MISVALSSLSSSPSSSPSEEVDDDQMASFTSSASGSSFSSSSFLTSNSTLMTEELNSNSSNSSSGYLPYSERPETYIVPVVFMFIFVTGIIGNVTLIVLLIKENLIKVPSYLYILNLSVGDLIVIIGTVPFAGTLYTFESWPYGLFVCKFSEFIRDVSLGVSVLTLSAMSIDRYKATFSKTIRAPAYSRANLAVGGPSFWRLIRSPTGGIMGSIWIISAAVATPTAYYSFILQYSVPIQNSQEIKTINICYPFPKELGPYYPKFVVLFKCIIYYVVPLIIISCCYVSIAVHLVRRSKQTTTVTTTMASSFKSSSAVELEHSQQLTGATSGNAEARGDSLRTTSPSPPLMRLIQTRLTSSSINLTAGGTPTGTVEVRRSSDNGTRIEQTQLTEARSTAFRKSVKKSQSRAKLILLLVMIFLVCFFPNHLFMIWFYFHPTATHDYNQFWHVLRIVAFCLTFLNSTLNPITLYLTSEQFKNLFHKYLNSSCCDENPASIRLQPDHRDDHATSSRHPTPVNQEASKRNMIHDDEDHQVNEGLMTLASSLEAKNNDDYHDDVDVECGHNADVRNNGNHTTGREETRENRYMTLGRMENNTRATHVNIMIDHQEDLNGNQNDDDEEREEDDEENQLFEKIDNDEGEGEDDEKDRGVEMNNLNHRISRYRSGRASLSSSSKRKSNKSGRMTTGTSASHVTKSQLVTSVKIDQYDEEIL